jgi:23S rRNA pseudouridine2605 synthase
MTDNHSGKRLQVYMASCGIGSRRNCEQIILTGRVSLNGERVTKMGTRVECGNVVTLDGRRITPISRKIYFALNKPPGYLCSNRDQDGRPLAGDLIKGFEELHIFHVGRLDYFSSGLIFYTNDGIFAHRVSHPSSGIRKTYRVETFHDIKERDMLQYQRGIKIEDCLYRLHSYRLIGKNRIDLCLLEGKNREIRQVFRHFRYHLKKVHRIRIGIVTVKGLAAGEYRMLNAREVRWFLNRAHIKN